MDKIEKYVARFFKKNRRNPYYVLYTGEIIKLAVRCGAKLPDTIVLTFDYGYAKGYRAALAEIRKGGAV